MWKLLYIDISEYKNIFVLCVILSWSLWFSVDLHNKFSHISRVASLIFWQVYEWIQSSSKWIVKSMGKTGWHIASEIHENMIHERMCHLFFISNCFNKTKCNDIEVIYPGNIWLEF